MAHSGLVFLAIVLVLYVFTFLIDSQGTIDALTLALRLLYQIFPILLIVFVLIFLSNLLINPTWVRSQLGSESGLRGWIIAVITGILSVGPVYAWYALLKDLRTKGMRTALISVFLYNRGIKLPLLPLMIHYFGVAYTLILAAYLILFSLLSGIVIEKLVGNKTLK